MIKQKLKVEGMHCSSCTLLIDGDIEDLDGVKGAKTNFAKEETEIEFDEDKVNTEKIIEVIKKTGYKATLKA